MSGLCHIISVLLAYSQLSANLIRFYSNRFLAYLFRLISWLFHFASHPNDSFPSLLASAHVSAVPSLLLSVPSRLLSAPIQSTPFLLFSILISLDAVLLSSSLLHFYSFRRRSAQSFSFSFPKHTVVSQLLHRYTFSPRNSASSSSLWPQNGHFFSSM